MTPPSDARSGRPASPGAEPPQDAPTEHAVPELDLRPAPSAAPRRKAAVAVEGPLELAVDPRALVRERSEAASLAVHAAASLVTSERPGALMSTRAGAVASAAGSAGAMRIAPSVQVDLAFDARLLADYGDPPRSWLRSPLYAYRVLRRRSELRAALVGRRDEAKRTAAETDNALVGFAERVRDTAEKTATYAPAFDELRPVEQLLRSRDQVLAAEQDAQSARLAQVDARLSKLEAELRLAHGAERALAAEVSHAQKALSGSSENDLPAPELADRAASNAELTQRHSSAKKRVSDGEVNVQAARAERRSLEHWFARKMGTRTSAVEESREEVRQRLLAIARRALADHAVFGDELEPAREQIASLESAARSAAGDVLVHEAALGAYDASTVRQGVVVAALLVLVLIVAPVVWRAVRVVEPPAPVPTGHVEDVAPALPTAPSGPSAAPSR